MCRRAHAEIRTRGLVDATGRRSPTIDWITAGDGRPPSQVAEDSGVAYYGRFFRSTDGAVPELRTPLLSRVGSVCLLCIPSDNGTWSTTMYTVSDDAPMRRLRDPDVFQRVIRSFPLHEHWLNGSPISGVDAMRGVVDRRRRFVVDGAPVITGMRSIADAHACTNPSIGRGMTLGLMHTALARDTVRAHLDDPAELARAFDAVTAAELDPWHEATAAQDRRTMAAMRADIDGRELALDPAAAVGAALDVASPLDEHAARWMLELRGCLALPSEVFARPGALEHVMAVAGGSELRPLPGPDRSRLLELVA